MEYGTFQIVSQFGGFAVLGAIAYLLIRWVMVKYDQALKALLDHIVTQNNILENHLSSILKQSQETCNVLTELVNQMRTSTSTAKESAASIQSEIRRLEDKMG